MDIVNPQGANDPNIVSQPDASIIGEVPKMDMERILPRQQSTGLSRGVQQLGTPNVYVDSGDNQIIVAKDSVNQVLMGDQANFGEGFYVTKPGIDVKTASNGDDFAFNSNQNVFKIVKSDTFSATDSYTVPNPGAGNFGHQYTLFATIPHGLDFTPAYIAYTASATDAVYDTVPSTSYSGSGGNATWITFGMLVTTQNIEFYADVLIYGAGALSYGVPTYKYYLLQETAN